MHFWRVFLQAKETIPNSRNPFITQFCSPQICPVKSFLKVFQCSFCLLTLDGWKQPNCPKLKETCQWKFIFSLASLIREIFGMELTAAVPFISLCYWRKAPPPRSCWNTFSLDFIHVQPLQADGSWNKILILDLSLRTGPSWRSAENT